MTGEANFQVGVIWPDVEDVPVLAANQFVTQLDAGSAGVEQIVLILGNVTPPLVLGPPEEVQAMLAAVGAVSVKALGRYALTRGRLEELIELLLQARQNWDSSMGGQGGLL
ncbi:hypothetical protein [Nocardioides sp.]|uniref:hypothetical protein n=1 Tax=Nocardioides sp. TaxID=35761 RepID=UPI003783BB7B